MCVFAAIGVRTIDMLCMDRTRSPDLIRDKAILLLVVVVDGFHPERRSRPFPNDIGAVLN